MVCWCLVFPVVIGMVCTLVSAIRRQRQLLIKQLTNRAKAANHVLPQGTAAVVVLGDIGRSPRMQHHAECLAAVRRSCFRMTDIGEENGKGDDVIDGKLIMKDNENDIHEMAFNVFVIAHKETICSATLERCTNVQFYTLYNSWSGMHRLNGIRTSHVWTKHFGKFLNLELQFSLFKKKFTPFVNKLVTSILRRLLVIVKYVEQCIWLLQVAWRITIEALILLWILECLPSLRLIILQNPPGLPAFLICRIVCMFRDCRCIVDWHNFGWNLLSLSASSNGGILQVLQRMGMERLVMWLELLGVRAVADFCICVSSSMKKHLVSYHRLAVTLVYDRPANTCGPICVVYKHCLLHNLFPISVEPILKDVDALYSSDHILNVTSESKSYLINKQETYKIDPLLYAIQRLSMNDDNVAMELENISTENENSILKMLSNWDMIEHVGNKSHLCEACELDIGLCDTTLIESNIERLLKIKQAAIRKLDKIIIEQSRFSEVEYNPNRSTITCRLRSMRPALVISSTSWTVDEDFGMLLNALRLYDDFLKSIYFSETGLGDNADKTNKVESIFPEKGLFGDRHTIVSKEGRRKYIKPKFYGVDSEENVNKVFVDKTIEEASAAQDYPPLVVIITGKGPMKDQWMQEANRQSLKFVRIRSTFMSLDDYYKLLASADIGISLHFSASGLDLPMKVVDMLGVGLPVLSVSYDTIHEILMPGLNSLLFDSSVSLFHCLKELLKGWPKMNKGNKLWEMRQFAEHNIPPPFVNEWAKVILPVISQWSI